MTHFISVVVGGLLLAEVEGWYFFYSVYSSGTQFVRSFYLSLIPITRRQGSLFFTDVSEGHGLSLLALNDSMGIISFIDILIS